ncbi:MAG TPA: response regulator transcription factor, partial [Dehalococcoidia bacterium]|nr:response regulator transcription factor [Dehalococcoidia bacterium]
DQIVEAIRAARKGESFLDPRVTRNVVERLTELTKAAPQPGDVLSDREREILLLVTQGLTNKEIAAQLFLSPYTARNHVIRILDKLGLSSRTEAAAEAVRLGLLET